MSLLEGGGTDVQGGGRIGLGCNGWREGLEKEGGRSAEGTEGKGGVCIE